MDNTIMTEGRLLPYVTFREIDLPELKSWRVGGKYYLVIGVEMVGVHSMKGMEAPNSDQAKMEGDFQIVSVQPMENKPAKMQEMNRKAFEKQLAQVKAGEYMK